MKHSERRIWLIQQLLNEKPEYKQYQIPQDEQGQKDLLRALMNVRMPDPIDDEFLRIQDDYLREETNRKGIVKLSGLSPWRRDDRIIYGKVICPDCRRKPWSIHVMISYWAASVLFITVWTTFCTAQRGFSFA